MIEIRILARFILHGQKVLALDDVSDSAKGEIFGIIGLSGAAKHIDPVHQYVENPPKGSIAGDGQEIALLVSMSFVWFVRKLG